MDESGQQNVPQVPQAPKKSKKRLIVTVAIVVVLLAGASVAAWIVIGLGDDKAGLNTDTSKTEQKDDDDTYVKVGDSSDAGDGLAPSHDDVYGTSYDKPATEGGE
ncbi:MAG: hypothetical protein LBL84_00505 [Candidatus Nomurabacteria bacterium]|jgi:hypothetical protein|nr:hypothetical protein [Candidatus Nomurabacteria bacterium]